MIAEHSQFRQKQPIVPEKAQKTHKSTACSCFPIAVSSSWSSSHLHFGIYKHKECAQKRFFPMNCDGTPSFKGSFELCCERYTKWAKKVCRICCKEKYLVSNFPASVDNWLNIVSSPGKIIILVVNARKCSFLPPFSFSSRPCMGIYSIVQHRLTDRLCVIYTLLGAG